MKSAKERIQRKIEEHELERKGKSESLKDEK
jgi:hypothetical protein